jgi:hypothetical protein
MGNKLPKKKYIYVYAMIFYYFIVSRERAMDVKQYVWRQLNYMTVNSTVVF